MKMTVTLTPEELKDIIKSYLETKFSSVGEVDLLVGEQWSGHGPNEYKTTVLKGASIEVEL